MLYIYVWAVCICIDYIQLSGLEGKVLKDVERTLLCSHARSQAHGRSTKLPDSKQIAHSSGQLSSPSGSLPWPKNIGAGWTCITCITCITMRCAACDKSVPFGTKPSPFSHLLTIRLWLRFLRFLLFLLFWFCAFGFLWFNWFFFFLGFGLLGYICIGRNALAKLKYHLRKTCSALQNLTIVYNSQKMQSWLSLVCQDRLLSKSKGTGKTQVCLWCETEILLDSWYTFRLIQVKRKAHDAHGHGVRQWLILGPGM